MESAAFDATIDAELDWRRRGPIDFDLGGGFRGEVTARASLDTLPLSTVDAFWESGLEGVVSAKLDLQGTP